MAATARFGHNTNEGVLGLPRGIGAAQEVAWKRRTLSGVWIDGRDRGHLPGSVSGPPTDLVLWPFLSIYLHLHYPFPNRISCDLKEGGYP
jgi:hypothetical protein